MWEAKWFKVALLKVLLGRCEAVQWKMHRSPLLSCFHPFFSGHNHPGSEAILSVLFWYLFWDRSFRFHFHFVSRFMKYSKCLMARSILSLISCFIKHNFSNAVSSKHKQTEKIGLWVPVLCQADSRFSLLFLKWWLLSVLGHFLRSVTFFHKKLELSGFVWIQAWETVKPSTSPLLNQVIRGVLVHNCSIWPCLFVPCHMCLRATRGYFYPLHDAKTCGPPDLLLGEHFQRVMGKWTSAPYTVIMPGALWVRLVMHSWELNW